VAADFSFLPIGQPMSGWIENAKPIDVAGYHPIPSDDDPPRLFPDLPTNADAGLINVATTFFEPPTDGGDLNVLSGDGPISGTTAPLRGARSASTPSSTGTPVPEPDEISLAALLLLCHPFSRKRRR
jgi:hypothetical protein